MSDKQKNYEPAFPCDRLAGMTLRDYFAAKAMQALLAYPGWLEGPPSELANAAYGLADEMMTERHE
jgi:hypothetical protein